MGIIRRFFKRIRSNIITGTLIALPVFTTFFVLYKAFVWIDSALPGILGKQWAPGLGILILLVCVWSIGLIAKFYVGKKIIALGNAILIRIPILNKIYLTVQQVVDTVSLHKKQVFERVVLAEYPRPGVYTIGFITSRDNHNFSEKTGKKLAAVFVPTTPNPTSGFLLYYPEEELIDVDISVEVAVKKIMSAGMIGDGQLVNPKTP